MRFMFLIALFVGSLAHGQSGYVRKSGDGMTGPLQFQTPFGTNRPALWFRHTTGTAMSIATQTTGYDLCIGEAATATTSQTPRICVTTAGSYPVVVGNGWNGSTFYDVKSKSITVAGAATGSLSCSSSYEGNAAHDTTKDRGTYCDGTTRRMLAYAGPLLHMAGYCTGTNCDDGVKFAATVAAGGTTGTILATCRVALMPFASTGTGTWQVILRNETAGADVCTASFTLPLTAGTASVATCGSVAANTIVQGDAYTARRNGGTGSPDPMVNIVCFEQ